MNAERVRIQTLHWIETIVIGLDLCPFARRSIDAARLRVEVSDVSSEGELAKLFVAELRHPESIPTVNITRLEALGMPALRRLLDS